MYHRLVLVKLLYAKQSQGSGFFRHSVVYKVSVYTQKGLGLALREGSDAETSDAKFGIKKLDTSSSFDILNRLGVDHPSVTDIQTELRHSSTVHTEAGAHCRSCLL